MEVSFSRDDLDAFGFLIGMIENRKVVMPGVEKQGADEQHHESEDTDARIF